MVEGNIYLKLREQRIALGMSQKDLGDKVGLPQQAINRIEQNQRKIDVDLFLKLCDALQLKKIGSFSINAVAAYYRDDNKCTETEELLLSLYQTLNDEGQKKVLEYTEMLTKIQEYTN